MHICAVFVCNQAYFNKFIYTVTQLIINGKFKGDICLVIGDDLYNNKVLECDTIINNNIIINYFPNINFSEDFLHIQRHMNREPHWFPKIFQFHKIHLFDVFFKKWDYIFYLDCGITVFSDVSPILNEVKEYTLLAHSDAYPIYEWKLNIL